MSFRLEKRGKVFLTLLAATLILMAALTFYIRNIQEQKLIKESSAGEAFISEDSSIYTDLDGNEKMLDSYIGEVIIVNSWASWSPFSAGELKKISKIADSFAEQSIKVVAINRAETTEVAQRYLQSIGQIDKVELILDPEDKYYRSIEGYTMPETVLYDREGNIYFHKRGEVDELELKEQIQTLLDSGSE